MIIIGPWATTLAHFVSSKLSHPLNRGQMARLRSPKSLALLGSSHVHNTLSQIMHFGRRNDGKKLEFKILSVENPIECSIVEHNNSNLLGIMHQFGLAPHGAGRRTLPLAYPPQGRLEIGQS